MTGRPAQPPTGPAVPPVTVAVPAAGGKTARAVRAALERRGCDVRTLARADADLDTGAGLAAAFAGCDAVWLAVPNLHPDEPGVVARVVDACRAARVPRLVYHSVAWPYAPAMPHHLDKAAGEDLVRRSGLRFTVLQPCAYVQNLLPGCRDGRLAVPYSPDTAFALVDLDDVAQATAAVLADTAGRHDGATYELGGPEPVSVRGLAAQAAEVTGRAVVAERLGWDSWAAGPGAALPLAQRERLRAMFDTYDRHGFPAGHLALAALLGRAPNTPVDVLRRDLAPALGAGVES